MKRPKSIMCYICGREFGTTSLKIHIKSCEKKWAIEQEKIFPPKNRKPCPQAPPNFDDIILVAQGKKPKSVLDSAADARGMNTGGYDLSLQAYNDAAFNEYNTKVLDECKHCGRTFKPEALVHHAKSCTADKPLKKRLIRPVKQNDDGNAEANNKQEEEKQSEPDRRQSAMPKKESVSKLQPIEQMSRMPRNENMAKTLMPRNENMAKVDQIKPKSIGNPKKKEEPQKRMPMRESMAKMSINEMPQEQIQMGGSKLKKPSSLMQGSSIGKGSRIGQGSKKE